MLKLQNVLKVEKYRFHSGANNLFRPVLMIFLQLPASRFLLVLLMELRLQKHSKFYIAMKKFGWAISHIFVFMQ